MESLRSYELQTLARLEQTLQQDVDLSTGDIKYMSFGVLKGIQWSKKSAGGAKNLATPAMPPPEVVSGLVLDTEA